MSFKLTEEQLMIQSMVRDLARAEFAPKAMERDKTKEFPAENLKKLGELGLMGMMIPPEYGGSGADTISYVLALAEVAYACASTAVVMSVHNSIVCESILRYGTDDQKEKYLKPMATGEMIGAFALTEPNAGSDPARQTTKAVFEGDSYVLNGTKQFITNGDIAGITVVMAVTNPSLGAHGGVTAFIVENETPGFSIGSLENKMGIRGSSTAELIFDDCRVPAENVLGQFGAGFLTFMKSLDIGRASLGAACLGGAQAVMEAAVKWAKARQQFGKPIAQKQSVRPGRPELNS